MGGIAQAVRSEEYSRRWAHECRVTGARINVSDNQIKFET